MTPASRLVAVALLLLLFSIGTVSAAPADFNLLSPGSASTPGPEVDAAALSAFTWEAAADAATYNFALNRPTTNFGQAGLTPEADGDDLTCDATTCTLTVDGAALLPVSGVYDWSITATATDTSTTVALNAPFHFTVDATPPPADFNLLTPDGPSYPGPQFSAAADLTTISWEAAENAASYRLELTRPSQGVYTLPDLTPEADGDTLACSVDTCTLTVNGAALLPENGDYRWSVTALAADGDATLAADAPYFFSLADPAIIPPGDFALLSPADERLFRDVDTLTAATWGTSTDALLYDFVLLHVSTDTGQRLGELLRLEGLTAATDADALACTTETCTLSLGQPVRDALENGRFTWTVQSRSNSGATEAANGPHTFTVNLDTIPLVADGGFETDAGGDKQPDAWTPKASDGDDKLKCRKVKPNGKVKEFSRSGDCAYQFKGKEGAGTVRLQQRLDDAHLQWLDIGSGDQLDITLWTWHALDIDGALRVIVRANYPEGSPAGKADKTVLSINAGTLKTYEETTGTLSLADDVERLRFQFRYTGTAGKVYVDDLSVTLAPVDGASSLLPLPAAPLPAPDAYRGG